MCRRGRTHLSDMTYISSPALPLAWRLAVIDMTKDTDSIGIPQQERASTGVAGQDDILGGGAAET